MTRGAGTAGASSVMLVGAKHGGKPENLKRRVMNKARLLLTAGLVAELSPRVRATPVGARRGLITAVRFPRGATRFGTTHMSRSARSAMAAAAIPLMERPGMISAGAILIGHPYYGYGYPYDECPLAAVGVAGDSLGAVTPGALGTSRYGWW